MKETLNNKREEILDLLVNKEINNDKVGDNFALNTSKFALLSIVQSATDFSFVELFSNLHEVIQWFFDNKYVEYYDDDKRIRVSLKLIRSRKLRKI
jgi:hypothetical protein